MLRRIIAGNAQGPRLFLVALFTLALATAFTRFYFLHEQLPRLVRAPSALLLAPVAMVDGLCYAAGIPGIYGKALPIFIVNFVFAGTLCGLVYLIRRAVGEKQHLTRRCSEPRPAPMRSFHVVGSSSLRPRALSGAVADLVSR